MVSRAMHSARDVGALSRSPWLAPLHPSFPPRSMRLQLPPRPPDRRLLPMLRVLMALTACSAATERAPLAQASEIPAPGAQLFTRLPSSYTGMSRSRTA